MTDFKSFDLKDAEYYFNLIIQTMRKLFLLLSLVIITTSCSSSDNEGSGKTDKGSNSFAPPEWIIGTWKSNFGGTYTFTKDDIIYGAGGTKTSTKEQVATLKKAGIEVSVKETKNNSSYSADYKFSESTVTFSFTKTSDTVIESTGFLDGTYTKQ